MFLLCHPRGKQVTLNFSSVVACAICEKKIIIKKLHFLNMFFCSMSDSYLRKMFIVIHWLNFFFLKGPLKYDELIHEEIQPSFLSGCRNLDVAAHRWAVMTTWSNPRAGFATPYVTVPLILCVQWVKVGDDCSFLVPYRRKPKVTILIGSVRPSVRPSVPSR